VIKNLLTLDRSLSSYRERGRRALTWFDVIKFQGGDAREEETIRIVIK